MHGAFPREDVDSCLSLTLLVGATLVHAIPGGEMINAAGLRPGTASAIIPPTRLPRVAVLFTEETWLCAERIVVVVAIVKLPQVWHGGVVCGVHSFYSVTELPTGSQMVMLDTRLKDALS